MARVDFATDEVVPGWSIDAALRLRPIDRLELEVRYAEEGWATASTAGRA